MFKKTLAAVAVGMVAFGAQAAEFTAADGTVFQANFDLLAEIANTKQTIGSNNILLGNGQIQLRATKTLSPDFSVFGQIEVDFDPAVNNAPALADDSRIGLASKTFGTFTVGQHDSFMEDNMAEALGVIAHPESGAFVTEPGVGNDGRRVQYISPKFQGLFGVVGMNISTKDTAGSEHNLGNDFVLGYDLNGLKVFVGQSTLPRWTDVAGTLNTIKSVTGAAASYKFGDTTVAVSGFKSTKTDDLDTNYVGIGVGHVMGPFDFNFAYQSVVTNTSTTVSTTANQWHAGMGYTVTKGTVIYFQTNSLGATANAGDIMVAGIKTTF
jgi:predicted porin